MAAPRQNKEGSWGVERENISEAGRAPGQRAPLPVAPGNRHQARSGNPDDGFRVHDSLVFGWRVEPSHFVIQVDNLIEGAG
jgi:hypothetical protein